MHKRLATGVFALLLADPNVSLDSRHFDLTDVADQPSAGVKCFPAQCPAAVDQRETITSGQTREKSRIEFPVNYWREIR